MNKRLIALFLCLVMMFSVFMTACAEDSEEDAKNELEQAKVASNMTLTMWIVSESPVSEEVRTDVSKAINALTKAKYKTQLEIYYLSEEEYFDKLTSAMETYAQTKKEQNADKPVETDTNGETVGTTVEEIVTDENGMYRDNYPIVLENQVDIIYIGDMKDGEGNLLMSGQQMYNALRADNWLASLDEAIKGDAKKIKEFVSPTLLSAVQEKGVTYAVPNNNVIGEYTYMCLNKEMMDRYSLQGHLTRGSITSFASEYIYQFLNMISLYEEKLYLDNPDHAGEEWEVLPVDATYEDCLAYLAYYWNINPEDYSIDSDKFSIFGTPLLGAQPSRGEDAVGVQSLLENEEFTYHYLELNKFRMEGESEGGRVFFRNESNQEKSYNAYGVKFVKGTLAELTVEDGVSYYDEGDVRYYVVPVSYPTATAEDIYGNMFAVATTTLNVDRSMQIVTYLNTNTEMRNLLQYGIKGKHYNLDNEGRAEPVTVKDSLDNDIPVYNMDIYATGNAFLAYPEPDMNPAIWENGKKQNRDSLVEPMLGFDLAEYASTATSFGIPTEYTASKPYSTTFRTGLSKEVLCEDSILAAWIAECDANDDAKGEGSVYVFRSREKTLNNEYAEILYLYNTTGEYRFSVESEEAPKESGTGYYRNNTYVYTKDEDLTGKYTLTMVYDLNLVRYEGQYNIVERELDGGEEASRTEYAYVETFTYKDRRYDFDLYDTDSYKLNVYGDLYLGDFYDNKDIFDELLALYETKGQGKANLELNWVDTTSSTEKDYHSFILYRKNITHTTLIDVFPTVSGDEINLVVNYDERTDSEIVDPPGYGEVGVRPGKRYLVYYITIETAKNVKVSLSCNVGQTTSEETLESKFIHEFAKENVIRQSDKPLNEELNRNIRFDAKGMLATDLVKYMVELNDLVVGLLDSCKTPEELERMLGYLGTLLNTKEELISLYKNFPEESYTYEQIDNDPLYYVYSDMFAVVVKDSNSIVSEKNFGELFYDLTHITNYGTMEEVLEYLPGIVVVSDEYRPIFYSPYGIYYLWMEAYGYLPANMKTTK